MEKVIKFGGSSLADARQFQKVKDIVLADASRNYVVVSAPGKRFDSDKKVTDMLYSCYAKAARGESFEDDFCEIKDRYLQIIDGLGLDLSLEKEFATIKAAFGANVGSDYAASRGEYLNAVILAHYLEFDFVDAEEIIFFNFDGSFDSEKTNEIASQVLRRRKKAVIPGFYGIMPNDTIKTFSRGGSDITGAIVARAIEADLYENFTDVSGFLMANPQIVKNPKVIDYITYHELRELSYMGATVLHDESIFPVRRSGIPINIKNTNRPEDPGTMIVANLPECIKKSNITGIAGKKHFSIISIEKDMMNQEFGFGRKVLECIEKNGVSFEHLPSGIDTMSIIVSTELIENKKSKIINDICATVNPDHISIEDGLSLIAVVGQGLISSRGSAARVFGAIARENINVRMIDQGSSELNIIVGVEDNDFEAALRAIYNEFVD